MGVYEKYNIDFDKIKPDLLEAFVAIYGEKNRQLLSKRINNIYINSYYTYQDLRRYVDGRINTKRKELTIRLLEENGFKLTEEQKEDILKRGNIDKLGEKEKRFLKICMGNESIYSENRYSGITKSFDEKTYQEANPAAKKRLEEQRVEILNLLGANVTTGNFQEMMQNGSLNSIMGKIEIIKSKIQTLDEEFKEFTLQFSEEQKQIKGDEVLDNETLKKYNLKYLTIIKGNLPKTEQREIASMLEHPSHYYYEYGKEYSFLSRNIKFPSILESFSTSAEETLKTGNELQKREILRNRVSYFKKMGYDFGENYEEYRNKPEIRQIIPDMEMAEQIKQAREACYREYQEEILRETGSYKENQKNLQRLGLVAQIDFPTEFLEKNITCTIPNATQKEEGLEERAIINIPIFNLSRDYRDVLLVHEVGHAMELELLEKDEKHLGFKTGFDYVKADLREEVQAPETGNNDRRDMELMSEIIHHQLAMEVTRNLHERGTYLIGDKNTEQIRGATSYEQYFDILHPFYEKYKEKIISARLTEKGFQEFMHEISPENFQQLNGIVKEYCQVPYLSVKKAIYEGRTTPETERWRSLMEEMNELMKHFTERPTNSLLTSVIKATKEGTRIGEINNAIREINGQIRGREGRTEQKNVEERQ